MEEIEINGKYFPKDQIIEKGETTIKKRKKAFLIIGIILLSLASLLLIIGLASIGTEGFESPIIAGALHFVPGLILFILSFKNGDYFETGKKILESQIPPNIGFDNKPVERLVYDKEIILNNKPRSVFFLNTNEKTFQIYTENRYSRILSKKDIIDFEIKVDDEIITNMKSTSKSKRGVGKAIAGGALFGTAGMIAGSVAGSTKTSTNMTQTQKEIHHYTLIIRVNDFIKAAYVIELESLQTTEDVATMLKIIIIDDKDKASEEIEIDNNKDANNNNKFEEMKKYKELLDMGIISNKEFEEKKKQVLK